MTHYKTLEDLKRAFGHSGSGSRSALYASAGADTMAFTFTHPEFLRSRDAGVVGEISVYIYVDVKSQLLSERLKYQDTETEIVESERSKRVCFMGCESVITRMCHRSRKYGNRSFTVVRVCSSNINVVNLLAKNGEFTDVFIGVCDGCNFGVNPECVNSLVEGNSVISAMMATRGPSWWITDHFNSAVVPNPLSVDDLIEGETDARLSVRKIALLSTKWGNYGQGTNIGGATVFKLIKSKGMQEAS